MRIYKLKIHNFATITFLRQISLHQRVIFYSGAINPFPCSDRGKCMCDHEDPQGIAYCECDEGFHGYNCELTDAPSPIPQTESQCLKSRCECLNPDTNEMCSGLGKCEKIENDLDWCDCQYVDADGNNVDRFCSNAKGLFGKWCQCNQWLCLGIPVPKALDGKGPFN